DEAHIDSCVSASRVLHSRLGERRAAVETPMHRLQTLVDMAVTPDLREHTQLVSLVEGLHRHVRMTPATNAAEPQELDALSLDLRHRVFATGLAKLARRKLLHFLAARLLDLMFHRQGIGGPV